MNNPKGQHFVPRMYLKRFAVNKKMFVYDKNNKNLQTNFKLLPIDNIAKINNFYTLKDTDGNPLYEFEKKLSILEFEADKVINKIEEQVKLTLSDFLILAFFIAFQMLRTPFFQNQMEKMMEDLQEEHFTFAIKELETKLIELEKNPEINSIEIDQKKEILDVFKKREGKFCIKRDFIISQMFESPGQEHLSLTRYIALLVLSRKMDIIRQTQNGFLLISDNPIVIIPPHSNKSNFEVNITTPGSKIVCPISKRTCILFSDPNLTNKETAPNNDILEMIFENEIIQSHRFVYSSDISLLQAKISHYLHP